MLSAFVLGLLLTPIVHAEILTVPVVPFVEISQQEIWMESLSECESGGSTTIKVLDTNGKYSYGLLQFQMGTWLKYKNLGATRENIFDGELQKTIARSMLDAGGWRNWLNCSLVVKRSLGSYPVSAD